MEKQQLVPSPIQLMSYKILHTLCIAELKPHQLFEWPNTISLEKIDVMAMLCRCQQNKRTPIFLLST